MPEFSYPFATSQVRAEEWQYLTSPHAVDGVLLGADGETPTGLQVDGSIGTLLLTVSPGRAAIRGFHYQLTETVTLNVPAVPASNLRFDRIVVRLERDLGRISVQLKVGVLGNYFQPPALATGQGNVWEISLGFIGVDPSGIMTQGGLTRDRIFVGPSAELSHAEYPYSLRARGRLVFDRRFGLTKPVLSSVDKLDPLDVQNSVAVVADLGPLHKFTPKVNGASPAGLTASCQWRLVAKDVVHVSYNLFFAQAWTGSVSPEAPISPLATSTLPQVTHGFMWTSTNAKLRPAALFWDGGDPDAYVAPSATNTELAPFTNPPAGTYLAFTGTYIVDPVWVDSAFRARG
ncbi:hypothetical protein [Yinghuangia sp. YIM S09857]|uniref:hypothetical protein n=1 Tax=Yinghuangia sp. YIM S09857 TaxID=3436929 RepID=UPI003F535900